MNAHASASKANRTTDGASQHSSDGENAVALAPPAYGLGFVDGGRASLGCSADATPGGDGQPLPSGPRVLFEPRFNSDFSGVRLHTGAQAAESARSVNALAYTVGKDIVFGHDQYRPDTDSGRRLVAHELAHVVQQSGAPRGGGSALSVAAASGDYEADAHRAARSAMLGLPAAVQVRTPLQMARLTQQEQIQTLDDEALAMEHAAVRAWVMAPENEKDPGNAGRREYLERLESEVSRRNPAHIAAGFRHTALAGIVKKGPDIPTPVGVFGVGSRASAAFFTEFGFGLKDGFMKQPTALKVELGTRMMTLAINPSFEFQLGYGKGMLKGVWGEIKGIVDLILLIPKLQIQANQWLTSLVVSSEKRDALLRKGHALKEALDEVVQKAVEEILRFFQDPESSVRRLQMLLDTLLSQGLEKAYALGHDSVKASFRHLEKPDGELGEELGRIAGSVLFQVVLLFATDAIGNLIAKGAGLLARIGKGIVEGVGEVFSGVRLLVTELIAVIRNLGRAVGKAMEGVLGALERLIQRVEAFFAEIAELAEALGPESALAGGGKVPGNVLMSEAREVGGAVKPVPTTTTTVEQLRTPKTPGVKSVPEVTPPAKTVERVELAAKHEAHIAETKKRIEQAQQAHSNALADLQKADCEVQIAREQIELAKSERAQATRAEDIEAATQLEAEATNLLERASWKADTAQQRIGAAEKEAQRQVANLKHQNQKAQELDKARRGYDEVMARHNQRYPPTSEWENNPYTNRIEQNVPRSLKKKINELESDLNKQIESSRLPEETERIKLREATPPPALRKGGVKSPERIRAEADAVANFEQKGLTTSNGEPINVTTGEPMPPDVSPDHIYPVDRIFREEGFNLLSLQDKVEVLELAENYMPLTKELQSSKLNRIMSDWFLTPEGKKIPIDIRQKLLELEQRAKQAVQREILKRRRLP